MSGRHEICNVALGLLGANAITSFDDGTLEAQSCSNFYEMAVQAVLEDHPWNFAEAVFELAADATAAHPSYAFSYAMPPDCIAARALLRTDGREARCVFKRLGNKICTDQDGGWLVYTSRAPEQRFSPQFRMALAKHLAYLLAGPVTESESKVQAWYRVYQDELQRARNRDSITDYPETVDTSEFIGVHTS
jgi:hypothetical protein